MAIRILDAATTARIAAGEVVERPSSIAKELIENALDAGSTSVTVEMREGGLEMLRVTDNGCGIAPEEVRLAFENHATSKLRAPEELDDIRTLGFRGEALPSVAAVSKVECVTRVRGADSGVKLVIEGGRFVSLTDAGCPEGTTLIVRDLFFNTPVRRAFLKKPAYEAGVLTDMVTRLILGNPGVAIRLINNGKTVCHSFGDGKLLHAALAVYGKETASLMTPLDEQVGGFRISGLIGAGDCQRNNRSGQSFFVNGRLVRCPLITQALELACKGRVMIGMYPMAVLNLTLPAHAVDVNVHPSKLEVRFRDEAGVRAAVQEMFARALEPGAMLDQHDSQPAKGAEQTEVRFTVHRPEDINKPTSVSNRSENATNVQKTPVAPNKSIENRPIAERTDVREKRTKSAFDGVPSPEPTEIKPVIVHPFEQQRLSLRESTFTPGRIVVGEDGGRESLPKAAAPETQTGQEANAYRVIGVAFKTYLIVEAEGSLLLIDQHAAHERILYERFSKLLDAGQTASQALLAPLILPVTAKEMAQIEENADLIRAAGFDVEPFGQRDVQVRAVPFVLGQAQVKPFFMEVLDRLETLKGMTAQRRQAELIQSACKHAVKAGDVLQDAEIAELIGAMRETRAPATCPHGRPVVRAFTEGELERMFKRIV